MARRLISVTTLFVWAAFTTYAEQSEDLRQQLEQLKQEYQQKITDLEQRIAALEKQRSQPSVPTQGAPQQSRSEGTTSQLSKAVAQAAKTAVSDQAQSAQGQLPSEPTYDQLQEAQTKI